MAGRPIKTKVGVYAGQRLKGPPVQALLTDEQRKLVENAAKKWCDEQKENGFHRTRSDWIREAILLVARKGGL